jgi:hypothetical protein
MSVEPTERDGVSAPTPLPSSSKPWRSSGFRLVLIALLLLTLGYVLAVWHTSRETDRFIKAKSAMVEATCNEAKLAHHDGRDDDALRLFQQCHEGVLTMKRYANDRSEADRDMELEGSRDTLKHVFDKR